MTAHPVPLHAAVSRWREDPYSRGGWSLLGIGGTDASRRALGAPFGRVQFAGEATHPEQSGMVHGAFEEGERAAAHCIARGDRRVVVVGAGAAGIGAARALRRAGIAVDLLEARQRIGGRTHSVAIAAPAADGTPRVMELGANWLQQGARNTLATHAARLGLGVVPTDFHRPLELGAVPPGQDRARIDAIIQALRLRAEAATAAGDVPLATVVEDFLRDPAPFDAASVRHAVDAEITLDTGVALEDLSSIGGFEPGVGAGDRWILGGYGALLEGLLEGLHPQLGCPVRHIDWSEAGVRVHTEDGALHAADAAIVTVPVAVLAAGSPTFEPPLPAAQRGALGQIITGRAEKAVLVFDTRWWPVSPSGYLRIAGREPGQISEWLDATEALGIPAITGIFVGTWAAALWDERTDAEVAAGAARVLWDAAGEAR